MAKGSITPVMVSCKVCGAEFQKRRYGPSVYCGAQCRRKVEWSAAIERRKESGLRCVGDKVPCVACGAETIFSGPSHKYCGVCKKAADKDRHARYRAANPEKVKAAQDQVDKRRKHNPARRAAMREYMKARNERNKEAPRWLLDRRMTSAIGIALRNKSAGGSWEMLVGYSLEALAVHLERQFTKGMSWSNIGDWHIDHIRPKSSFVYESHEDVAFKDCWDLTNLRPLWASENLKKKNKRIFLI